MTTPVLILAALSIIGWWVAGGPRFGRRRGDVAAVVDPVSERRQALADARDPHGRRAHVDAASTAAEVERHANQVEVGHGRAIA